MGSGITIVDDVILLLISKEAVAIDNKKFIIIREREGEKERERDCVLWGRVYSGPAPTQQPLRNQISPIYQTWTLGVALPRMVGGLPPPQTPCKQARERIPNLSATILCSNDKAVPLARETRYSCSSCSPFFKDRRSIWPIPNRIRDQL